MNVEGEFRDRKGYQEKDGAGPVFMPSWLQSSSEGVKAKPLLAVPFTLLRANSVC